MLQPRFALDHMTTRPLVPDAFFASAYALKTSRADLRGGRGVVLVADGAPLQPMRAVATADRTAALGEDGRPSPHPVKSLSSDLHAHGYPEAPLTETAAFIAARLSA